MQGGPISGTFPGQTSQLCFTSNPQSHIPSSQHVDPLHEIHTATGSTSYSLSDNPSTDTHRLNGDSPWTPLDAATQRSQALIPGDATSRFSKRRRLENLNPEDLQYLQGPRSDSGYRTWSDATPFNFTFSDPGTGHLSAQRYVPSSFTSSAEENYVCSSSGDPHEDIGDNVSQSVPEQDSSEIADNEPRTWHCHRKDCNWTGERGWCHETVCSLSSNAPRTIIDICLRSEDYFHLQQAKTRQEAAVREDASQQLTSPVCAANSPDMISPEQWNLAANRQYPMNRYQSSARLPMRNDVRHLVGRTNSQPSRSNLTVPSFQQARPTITPPNRNHAQSMHQSPRGPSSPSINQTPSSPVVSELPAQKMVDLSPSDVSSKGPLSQPGTHGQSALSNSSRSIDLDRSDIDQNLEQQPASSAARLGEGPDDLVQLIQTTLGSNPEATNALTRLLQMIHSGATSLSNSGNQSSPKLTGAENASVGATKPTANCHLCPQKFTRKCDLKKHLKRHNKPYYCTYQNCKSKPFGSKADWKRHENTQHFQLECWQCPEPPSSKDAGHGSCGKLFFRRETFLGHLKAVHQINDDTDLKRLAKDKKIGRDGHRSFWCGFCRIIVRLQEKGLKGVEERFDHLESHFMEQQRKGHKGLRGWQNPPHGVGVSDDESALDEDSSETETSSGGGTSEEEERDGRQIRRPQPSQSKKPPSVPISTAATDHIRSAPTTNKNSMVRCCSCSFIYLLANSTKCVECQHDPCRMCDVDRVSAEKDSSFFQ
ncbi:MAG: hypothetical protein Q9160_004548 [Pyrenula sp. 1 TL-2023]